MIQSATLAIVLLAMAHQNGRRATETRRAQEAAETRLAMERAHAAELEEAARRAEEAAAAEAADARADKAIAVATLEHQVAAERNRAADSERMLEVERKRQGPIVYSHKYSFDLRLDRGKNTCFLLVSKMNDKI